MKRLTKEEFIEKSKQKHGDKYNYSLVEYKNNRTKVKIICPTHGIFEQTPDCHFNRGCDKCGGTATLTKNEFIEKSKNIHKNKYDYSLVDYKNNSTKVKIICDKHGVFEQEPSSHINHKNGCPKCAYILKADIIRLTKEVFIENAKKIHGDKYDYSLVNYTNSHIKIIIICPKHGEFSQKPNAHLNGRGCPVCNESKGEKEIKKYLKENNIKYKPQKTFDNCNYKYVLRFDFYLPEYNLCVEYNGIQHYIPIDFFGGIKTFNVNKERFKIKENFCEENNIDLLIIKYDDNIIEKITNQLTYYSKDIS